MIKRLGLPSNCEFYFVSLHKNSTMYNRIIDNTWDFRTANTKEYTHCYHTYPAMMIPQVARKLIANYAPKGKLELIFDPYMGSGTSLVEASIKNINSIGTDLNPLARLISRVKTTHYDVNVITHILSEIQLQIGFYSEAKVVNRNFERISNYAYWYFEESLLKLSYLAQLIDEIDLPIYKDFFNICISETVREVSFTRNGEFKRYRMTEERISKFNPDVFKTFELKVIRNLKGLVEYNQIKNESCSVICDFNSVTEIPNELIAKESVDMVITSPPYGDSHTTVAYGQFSRWANEWFGYENSQKLDSILMGGRKQLSKLFGECIISSELNDIKEKDEKRYIEVISFLNDYYQSIRNVALTIRHGGRVCYVVGNRRVKGTQINLDYFTAEMFERFGFKHDVTIVRAIPNKRMPSKNSPTNKTGEKVSTMTNEYIVVLTKQ